MITEQFNYTKLKRRSVEGQRLYTTPNDVAVPSVTTILDKTKPEEAKAALRNWRKRVGNAKAAEITKSETGYIGAKKNQNLREDTGSGFLKKLYRG